MTDLERFESLFKETGVVFDKMEEDLTYTFEAEEAFSSDGGRVFRAVPHTVLSPGQAHFFFDEDGRYFGVYWDDMGYFDPRKEDDGDQV